MYEEFFGMANTPFTRNVPVEKLYESPAMKEALGGLCYVADRQEFAVITADPGCGKSTLIRKLEQELPKGEYLLLYVSDSNLTPRWLYHGLLAPLGVESRFYRGDAKRQLKQQIEIIHRVNHQKVVCVVDEAHLLERESLEEIRFVLNDKYDSESPMALVLVGQPELMEGKLNMQKYTAIRQRIRYYCKLPHLDRSETEQYVRSHMDYSECSQEIFTTSAYDEIYRVSNGTPRMINLICDKSLMYAFQQKHKLIDDHMVNTVATTEAVFTL